MWRLIYFIPIWIMHTVVWVLIALAAWVLIPIAVLFRAYEVQASPITGEPLLQYKWKIMLPYSNWGDGIYEGLQFGHRGEMLEKFLGIALSKELKKDIHIIYWTLIRNPVNNVRFFPIMGVKPISSKIKFVGSENCVEDSSNDDKEVWYLCWQGVYGGFRIHIRFKTFMLRIMFGWKLRPEDTKAISNFIRSQKVGFAYQCRVSRRY